MRLVVLGKLNKQIASELGTSEVTVKIHRGNVKEIGADESWQIEYYPGHFERLHHVRKKYACPACEHNGDSTLYVNQTES